MKAVLFDFDGTLANSRQIILASLKGACDELNLSLPSEQQCLLGVGVPLLKAVEMIFSDQDPVLYPKIEKSYRAVYQKLRAGEIEVDPFYPGVEEGLVQLQQAGLQLGIVTSKHRDSMEQTMDRMDLYRFFSVMKAGDDGVGKPAPDLLLAAMSDMKVMASDVPYIGDTVHDMKAAKAAGMEAIGVSWGFHAVDDLRREGANEIVDDFSQLTEILLAKRSAA